MIYFCNFQYPFAHQRYIIKRKFLLDNHIFYSTYKRGQDVPFMAQVLHCAEYFYAVAKPVYVHRAGYKTVTFSEEKTRDYVNAICDVIQLAIQYNYSDLFISMVHELDCFAKEIWYNQKEDLHRWDNINLVNELIQRGKEKFHDAETIHYLMNEDEYKVHVLYLEKEKEHIINTLDASSKIVIYGAGKGARRILFFLRQNEYNVEYFVVSNKNENISKIEDINVIEIEELEMKEDYLFVLGAMECSTKDEMKNILKQNGCNKILDMEL